MLRLQCFKKSFIIFEISTLEFFKNKFLAKTENFGIGYAFFNGPGLVFSESPGPNLDPCPLYKAHAFFKKQRFFSTSVTVA